METFDKSDLKKLFKPEEKSSGEDNGQVTIIGGSKLFHGAPIFALKAASRIVDMVFFATPEPSVGRVAEQIKSKLLNFIWVDWGDVEAYIKKSEAVLIGPGFMRFGSEHTKDSDKLPNNHQEGILTRLITESFLTKFPDKKWVIDAGSLQVMDVNWIPGGSVITPNNKEFQILFGEQEKDADLFKLSVDEKAEVAKRVANKHKCTIVLKGPETLIVSQDKVLKVVGGNPGLTKGGTGDVLAGLTVALLAKNEPFLAASAASFIVKAAADELNEKMGVNFNSDDLADQVPITLNNLIK